MFFIIFYNPFAFVAAIKTFAIEQQTETGRESLRISVQCFKIQVRMAKGIRIATHEEVVFNVVLSALILITGIERLRTGHIDGWDVEVVKESYKEIQ